MVHHYVCKFCLVLYSGVLITIIFSSVTSVQKDGISQVFDERFDEAYDLTVKAGDLKEVKWGRVDYMNVTRITTKWNVWRYVGLFLARPY